MLSMSVIRSRRRQVSADAGGRLNRVERALLRAAATGQVVDLRTGDTRLDNPAYAAKWSKGRSVRAGFLADLLTGNQPISTGRLRSVKLIGARITGTLDLEARKLMCPVVLGHCCFDQVINLGEAEAVSVYFPGCHVPGLNADQLRTTGNAAFNVGFVAWGETRLLGAQIGGQLNFSGASLTNTDGPALGADGLAVGQDLICDHGFIAYGGISLLGARIDGQVSFRGARLANDDGGAFSADNLIVDQSMFCDDGFTVRGGMSLLGARVGGELSFCRATITNDKRPALDAESLTVSQSVLCRDGFIAHGEVRLRGAHIGGVLNLCGATLVNENGPALDADALAVDQAILCRDGFNAHGEVRLLSAHVGGQLTLRGARLANEKGPALNAESLTVSQSVLCRDGFIAHGEVRLRGAHIGGQLDLCGANLTSTVGPALGADSLAVDQAMLCYDGFSAHGEIRLSGARIGRQLALSGAILANDIGDALTAENLAVDGDMICDNGFTVQGGVNLTNAKVATFYDEQNSWPDKIQIRGFAYDRFGNQGVRARARLQWLQRNVGPFTPQIYDQLADAYRRAGDEGAARKVAVAKQWRRRKPYNAVSWLWWVTVGYGYRTWQAFIWAAVLAVVGALVFSGAYPAHMVKLTAHPPQFEPVIYALDVLLPIGGLGQKSAWQPTGGYLDWYWVLSIAGWVLSAAVVAGLTGILKRD